MAAHHGVGAMKWLTGINAKVSNTSTGFYAKMWRRVLIRENFNLDAIELLDQKLSET
jgi:hypothetical protein